MNTHPKDQALVPECDGCTKANTRRNICNVIEHPAVWWRFGACTARSDDPAWEKKAEAAVKMYRLTAIVEGEK